LVGEWSAVQADVRPERPRLLAEQQASHDDSEKEAARSEKPTAIRQRPHPLEPLLASGLKVESLYHLHVWRWIPEGRICELLACVV
jgi:hypothetical protein